MKRLLSPHGRYLIIPALFAIIPLFTNEAYTEQKGVSGTIKNSVTKVNIQTKVDETISLPDKVVRVSSKYKGSVFWTETRKDKVERYKCTQCHNNKTVTADNAANVAHGDIVLDHGGTERPLSCFTCHKEDQRNHFETEKGITVDMDHIYQLCGQCHFRQKKDWVGGAHGKRVDNWAGKRVVNNCTSCHDPHSPLFKKRWPATYSLPLEK